MFEKLKEEVNQQNVHTFHFYGAASRSVATFLCHDIDNRDEVMVTRIMLQYIFFSCVAYAKVPD